MTILNLKSLVGKFNDAMRSITEAAVGFCVVRTQYEVEIEHFLLKAIEAGGTDLPLIFEHYGVSRERLTAELTASLDRLKVGNPRSPAFSVTLIDIFAASWTVATLNYDRSQIRTGFVLLALLAEDHHARLLRGVSQELQKIPLEDLRKNFSAAIESSKESAGLHSAAQQKADDTLGSSETHTPYLDQYTTDLTKNAREGRVDMVIGRDQEIRQMIDVLMRRRQNNPILTGEAGVGKTAVVEGLALHITEGYVPPALRNVRLHTLDLALLQAGASVKGEFESRLNGLIKEVKSSPQPVILFIDEAHTIIGAGGLPGQGDAANILKPALARGELRTIAATTWSEYKRYFEKDAALARRFQVVKVDEPSEIQCEAMLRGILPSLEKHHGVRIAEEAVSAAVRLSHRYMAGRQLPDKAVSVLDTACARVALSMSASPSVIEEVRRKIAITETQKRVLAREQATGSHHGERLQEIETALDEATEKLAQLQKQWERENGLVALIHTLRARLEAGEAQNAAARSSDLEELSRLRYELKFLQRENALALVLVDALVVAAVVAEWTGVPLGKMLNDEIDQILSLDEGLKKRVIGQDHAMSAIAQRVQTSRANLDDPRKPIGVFMLVGPSGVGKTETALALTDLLYGGEHTLITINMSEFQEPHSVSTLKGAPPGYVGYGEGGVLTEAVRRQPYSVILLDEVEKAHPDVLELFFQVFDKGSMEDGEGRSIDFRNTLILLTTNAASDLMMRLSATPETVLLPEEMVAAIRPELNRIFKPALLGRTLVVPYYPVRDEVLQQIVRLKMARIQRRMLDNHKVVLLYDDALLELVADRCIEAESGARNVDHLLSNTLLPEISRQVLARMAEETPMESVSIGVSAEGKFMYSWKASAAAGDHPHILSPV